MKQNRYIVVKRILSIFKYIVETKETNIDTLALEFKVGVRTIRRDLTALNELGLIKQEISFNKLLYKEIKLAEGRLKARNKRHEFKETLISQNKLAKNFQDEVFKNLRH